ncbi:uncharacterized protein LOC111343203 isoform X1 [Stylophora pistillata]|uniref:uncharacterized protein LOC111343203 isoform X1 n=1 Tax=Stylophora pistillata TaxID=50429 RepID=UPI000C057D00|nr:uncharacterized protein LOC111343203 isoform X1 [Stylophora pistillata]
MPLTKGTSALKEKPLSETELEGKRRQHEENEGIERTERKKETNKLSSPQERHNYGAVSPCYRAGFVFLETRLLHGEISYRKWHIVKRKDQWKPSETHLSDLRAKQFTEPSSVRFFATGNGGINFLVLPTTWWRRCIDCFRMCCSCGCIHDD